MTKCIQCGSEQIASVGAKCSDLCSFSYQNQEKNGYVPENVGIGGGDYVEFDYCLNCGQIQGDFPIKNLPYMGEGYCPECGSYLPNADDEENLESEWGFDCVSCGWHGPLSALITKEEAWELSNEITDEDKAFLNKKIEAEPDDSFWD
jgi:hypothetical protein